MNFLIENVHTFVLTKILNMKFDIEVRRIAIEEAVSADVNGKRFSVSVRADVKQQYIDVFILDMDAGRSMHWRANGNFFDEDQNLSFGYPDMQPLFLPMFDNLGVDSGTVVNVGKYAQFQLIYNKYHENYYSQKKEG